MFCLITREVTCGQPSVEHGFKDSCIGKRAALCPQGGVEVQSRACMLRLLK